MYRFYLYYLYSTYFNDLFEQGQFALEVSIKAISFYKNYFGVSYPLPKYDSIAIADFQCGAMENWGLVRKLFKLYN